MKTIFSLAVLATLALTSCKKDYTCACTTTVHQPEISWGGDVYQEESTTTTPSSTTIKDKKDDAKTKCESMNGTTTTETSWSQSGFGDPTTTTVKCQIQ